MPGEPAEGEELMAVEGPLETGGSGRVVGTPVGNIGCNNIVLGKVGNNVENLEVVKFVAALSVVGD